MPSRPASASGSCKLLEDKGIAKDGARFLRRAEKKAMAALEDAGELTAADLSKRVEELAIRIPMNEGKAYASTIGVGTRVLLLLAADGRVVRGRTTGGWTSSRHLWAPARSVARRADRRPAGRGGAGGARARLARSLRPGHRRRPQVVDRLDARPHPGRAGRTRRRDASTSTAHEGVVLAGDTSRRPLEPFVTLLPGLDPTTMGWKERAWYLGDHRPRIFDTQRQRRPHGVGRRADRRRLGAAQDR